MALSNYTEMQASVLDWMERAGQTGQVIDWITLAEARLNRELGPVETDASLTGTVGSRDIDLSALSMVQPVALFIADPGPGDERILSPANPGSMVRYDSSDRPTQWCLTSSTTITLNHPCALAYAFRLRYRQRFALSVSSTNWLLTNHPDVYLAAAIVWGNAYNESLSAASAWKGILDEAIPSIRNTLAKGRKGQAKVDPALTLRGGALNYSDWLVGP